MNRAITIEQLRELLEYEPFTGILRWKVCRGAARPGSIAGTISDIGRVIVRINHHTYKAHILAWALHYGEWPTMEIDHKDRNPCNNAIKNLRPSTRSQNCFNQGILARNSTGFKGVSLNKKRNKFVARICAHGVGHHLGYFDRAEEAHEIYSLAAVMLHGEFACTE